MAYEGNTQKYEQWRIFSICYDIEGIIAYWDYYMYYKLKIIPSQGFPILSFLLWGGIASCGYYLLKAMKK